MRSAHANCRNLALFALVIGLTAHAPAVSPQTMVANPAHIGVTYDPTITVSNDSGFAVAVTTAVVVFTKTPAGFVPSQDLTAPSQFRSSPCRSARSLSAT